MGCSAGLIIVIPNVCVTEPNAPCGRVSEAEGLFAAEQYERKANSATTAN